MTVDEQIRIAILYHGDRSGRAAATAEKSRFLAVFDALAALGIRTEPAVYHDDFAGEVLAQLLNVDGVLVWVNPIEDGDDRTKLDEVLRDVAGNGVFVSAHPDVISRLGTKEVLHRTREMEWGVSDTQLHRNIEQFRTALMIQLAAGKIRVLKKIRGNGGNGVWKIEPLPGERKMPADMMQAIVRTRFAQRGSVDESIKLGEFVTTFAQYFSEGGRIIDQAYQPRLPEGMVRCYLVQDKIAGFGHQAINALCPLPAGASVDEVPTPTPRLYYPPTMPQFQDLKTRMETSWVPALRRLLNIEKSALPIIWDCDFLLGPKTKSGEDTYVLCEINASCVSPFPDAAIEEIAIATSKRVRDTRLRRRRRRPASGP